MKNSLITLFVLSLIIVVSSCKKDQKLEIPGSYDGTSYTSAITEEQQLKTNLSNLSTEIKKGKDGVYLLNASNLNTLFEAGSPNLKSITSSDFTAKINSYFTELEDACGQTFDPFSPNTSGGIYGGSSKYLVNEDGVEFGEVVDKGLYGSAFYNHVHEILEDDDIDEAELHSALALFGAHPDFSNSDKIAYHANPDSYIAKYAARRDDGSGDGFYLTIKKYFIQLQAAIQQDDDDKDDDDFEDEREEASEKIIQNMEKALAATIINYCFSARTSITKTSPTSSDFGSAIHSLGEAIGFTVGLKYAEHTLVPESTFTNVLNKLHFSESGSSDVNSFITNPAVYASDLTDAVNILKSAYGFSDAQLEAFKLNQVDVREP